MSTTGPSKLDSREVRIGRILSEIHDGRAGGMALNDAKILAENPDIADELRLHLDTLREVHRTDHTIDGLIRQGILSPPAGPDHVAMLGPYRILGCIGRGGMGVVLEAHDETLRRRVAIKMLRPDLTDDATVVARFQREARAAAAVSHKNILTVYAVGEHHGSHYIVMQRIAGPTLADVIRDHGPLPAEFVRAVFQQLLEGLAAAHAAGLIHRDIKPANLLFDVPDSAMGDPARSAQPESPAITHAPELNRVFAGRLKITDFGLARVASSQTRLTLPEQRFGTPQYMSPEQARGETDIDHRTDLYSAGVVLYEMLAGRPPFRAETPTAVVHQVLATDPKAPRSIVADCDPVLATIALRLMAKRREDRLESAVECCDAILRGEPANSPERFRERRRKAMCVGILLGTCMVVAPVLFGLFSSAPISDVRVLDGKDVQVRRAGSDNWVSLHRFAAPGGVAGVALAHGEQPNLNVVAAALNPSLGGKCLMGFHGDGGMAWEKNMFDPQPWPDCKPSKSWVGVEVLAGPIDDRPGDEFVVVASDELEYPTRISIIDPQQGKILGTFWNYGDVNGNSNQIQNVQIVEDYFGETMAAIVICGMNNKLDGFDDSTTGEVAPFTHWDIVSVLMVLDPREIIRLGECMGPPAVGRPNCGLGGVYAYAMLSLSHGEHPSDEARTHHRIAPRPEEQGKIDSVRYFADAGSDVGAPCFSVGVSCLRGSQGARLQLDRNLNVHSVVRGPEPGPMKTDESWSKLWVPVVQEGRLLSPPRKSQ